MHVKNRFVRSATVECLADENNRITDEYIKVYTRLAKGGVGLIIPGNYFVNSIGRVVNRVPVLDRDEVIDDLRRLTDTVHEHGAKIVAELNHGGRQSNPEVTGEQPVSASRVKDKLTGIRPRAMTPDEIMDTVRAFADAAYRAKAAGFDGVELNGGHGYLINQFLSGYTNRRKDSWGGSLENRMRFLLDIYGAIRRKVGKEYPVFIKINGEDGMKGGFTLEESIIVCRKLAELGMDAIEVSGGIKETGFTTTRGDVPADLILKKIGFFTGKLFRIFFEQKMRKACEFTEGYFLPHASAIKKNITVPVIAVGGMRNVSMMEHALTDGQADFIAMSRPFIRQPQLVKMIQENPESNPVNCVNCNRCTYEIAVNSRPIRCYYKPDLALKISRV